MVCKSKEVLLEQVILGPGVDKCMSVPERNSYIVFGQNT